MLTKYLSISLTFVYSVYFYSNSCHHICGEKKRNTCFLKGTKFSSIYIGEIQLVYLEDHIVVVNNEHSIIKISGDKPKSCMFWVFATFRTTFFVGRICSYMNWHGGDPIERSEAATKNDQKMPFLVAAFSLLSSAIRLDSTFLQFFNL